MDSVALRSMNRGDSHVLVIGGGGILLVGGDVELVTSLDGNVLVSDSVSGTDLRSFLDACQYCEDGSAG
jgi:hypothetical protein